MGYGLEPLGRRRSQAPGGSFEVPGAAVSGKGAQTGYRTGMRPCGLVLCLILTGRHSLPCSYPFLAGPGPRSGYNCQHHPVNSDFKAFLQNGNSFQSTSQWELSPKYMGMALWPKEVFYLPLKKGQKQALVHCMQSELDFLESCHLRDWKCWRGDQKETPNTVPLSLREWFWVTSVLSGSHFRTWFCA